MACSPLSCWLHSLKPVRCRPPTQVATSRFPRTSAGSPHGLPRQSRLASYFPESRSTHIERFLAHLHRAASPPFSFGWPFHSCRAPARTLWCFSDEVAATKAALTSEQRSATVCAYGGAESLAVCPTYRVRRPWRAGFFVVRLFATRSQV